MKTRHRLCAIVLFALSMLSADASFAQSPEVTDNDILEGVETELRAEESISADLIDVGVRSGVVTLSGETFTLLGKRQATRVVESLRGVRSIVNRIRVRPSSADDTEIHADVRATLFDDAVADSHEIDAKVQAGKVTLSGTVDSFPELALTEAAVASVRGVAAIDNQITVKPKDSRRDEEIKPEIIRRFELSPYLAEDLLTANVANGFVTLSGEVGSPNEKNLARVLSWVAGVRGVNERAIVVNPDLKPDRRRKKSIALRNEVDIKRAVKDALLHDPRIRGTQLGVHVRFATVSLSGSVATLSAKKAAEQDAKNTLGVRRVINNLKVKIPDWPGDVAVGEQVRKALKRDGHLSDSAIRVSSHFGKVYLSGDVNTYFEKYRAETVAANVRTVMEVVNRIKVNAEWTPKPDEDIREDLERRLRLSPFLDAQHVTSTVSGGEVALRGTVDTWQEHAEATRHAQRSGAKQVKNELDVRASRKTPSGLKAAVIVNQAEYELADHQKGKEFRKVLEFVRDRGGLVGDLPDAPSIDLTLRLENDGKLPLNIRFGHDRGSVELSLTGEGVVGVPNRQAFAADFRVGSVVTLQPGNRVELPIESLDYGFRGEGNRWYWTEPGKHSLLVTFTWPTDVTGFSMHSVTASPIELLVR